MESNHQPPTTRLRMKSALFQLSYRCIESLVGFEPTTSQLH